MKQPAIKYWRNEWQFSPQSNHILYGMLAVRSLNSKHLMIFSGFFYGCDSGVIFFLSTCSFPCLLLHRSLCVLLFVSLTDVLLDKVQYLEIRLCFRLVTPAKTAVFAPDVSLQMPLL